MSNLKYVGKSIIREDSFDKARGKTVYAGDIELPGMLYAKLVLSEKAHAEVEIDKTEAMQVDGIKAIYTNDDVPNVFYNGFEWHSSINRFRDEQLLNKKARYFGDRIAVVVGESKDCVREAISKLTIAYKELEPVIGLEAAKKGDTIITGKDNISFEGEIDVGDYKSKFAEADFIIEDIGTTPKIHHAAIEPHVCVSEINDRGDLIVHSPCQVASQIQMHIANILSIPRNRVRVIKTIMGGSFGGKTIPIIEPIAAFLTYKLGKPIMLYMDRTDSIIGTVTRNASEIKVSTAIDKEGNILARNIESSIDGGGYNTNSSAIAMALGKKLYRLYDIQDQKYIGKTYYTNTIPGGACRGYGSPQAHAITEVNIDNAANTIGMDPCEFRLKNLVEPGAKDPSGATDIGNAKIKECVIEGMKEFNWLDRRTSVKEKNTDRYAYGIGMACGTHGNGYTGGFADYTSVDMTLFSDGSVFAKCSLHDLGCGTITTMQQIAAEALDLDVNMIRVTEADTLYTPEDSAGTQASRVTYVAGGAMKQAGEEIREQIIEIYSDYKNIDKDKLATDKGYVFEIGSNEKMSYADIAKISELELEKGITTFVKYNAPSNPASFAAYFAEVKVDKYLGLVDIIDTLAIHDIGQSINPMLVQGQIEGGVQFALGMALMEDINITNTGVVKSTNFSKYHIINSTSMPKIKVMTIEEGEDNGPYGAKSVGEMATVAPAPAVMNAINHALGTNIITYPATPELIVAELEKMKK